jgi:stage V sporulation protein B
MAPLTNEMILKKGIIVNTVGIVSKFSKAFYLILFSTFLGATQFGVYTYSFALFEVACTILQFGYGQNLAVQFGKYRHRGLKKYIFKAGNHIFLRAALISTFAAAAFYFLLPHVFEHIGHQDEYVVPLQILCFAIPAYALKYNILFSIRASFDTRYEVIVLSMVEPLLILLGGWVAFQFHVDIQSLSWSLVAVFHATLALSYWLYSRKYMQAVNEMDPKFYFRKFFKSSYPVAFMEIMNMFMGKSDLLFIGYFVNPALVGIYGAAYEVSSMITKIKAAIEPTLPSLMQKIHHENDKEKVREWFTRSMFWTLLPTTAIAGFEILDPDFFMSFFKFGPSYHTFFMVLPVLAFGRLFHAVFGLIDSPLYMVDHSHSSMRISLLNFICNMTLFAILIPKIGVFGAAIGYSISAIITTIYRLYLSKKIFKIIPVNWSFAIPITSLILGLIAAKFTQSYVSSPSYMHTAIVFVVFAAIYSACFQSLRKTKLSKQSYI